MTTRRRAVLAITLATILAAALFQQQEGGRTTAALEGTIHYPDLQTVIPLDEFSIIQPTPTTREFRYTHNISNFGDGPLEISPTYDAATDSARGFQQLYTHDAFNFWTVVTQLPVIGKFVYHAVHGHLHFPLARFGLYSVRPDGSVGDSVAVAPKVGFCIADTLQMASIPHVGVRGYGAGACAEPGATLGISVGYGDLYNFLDDGQSIDATGVPDGVYWFRAITDPFNYLAEKDESNNITDIKVQISGLTVTVLSGPVYPDSTPPSVTLTSPPAGNVSGNNVVLSANAGDPSGITSVQFLLDGEPLGPVLTAPPYTSSWDTTTTSDGVHYLSAHAEAGSSFFGSAPAVVVTVSNGSAPPPPQPFTITNVAPINRTSSSATITWTTSVPATSQVDYGLDAAYGSVVSDSTQVVSHAVTLNGLAPATTYHYRVTSRDSAGNVVSTGDLVFGTAGISELSCTITAPVNGSSVAGPVTVRADAVGTVSVKWVQFLLDGANLGPETGTQPYSTNWDTTSVPDGPHTLACIARDPTGNRTTSPPVTVTVANSLPPGLVAAYSFDDGAGSTVSDTSAEKNTGIVQSATWTTQGRYNGALNFNGTNSLVSVADSASLDLTPGMTLEAWVLPTTLSGDWRTVALKQRPGGLAYALYAADGASRPPAGYVNTGSQDRPVTALSLLSTTSWTHLATTYDGSVLRLYVNGSEVQATAVTGSIVASSSPLSIGGNNVWGEFFSGTIDEVRVYNRALSDVEIQRDMNTPLALFDRTPPSVSIEAPIDGAAVNGTVTVLATTQDNVAVAGVQFRLDGVDLGAEDTTPPYSVAWNTTQVSDGRHTISAISRDVSGNTASATVAVNVTNTDRNPPSVAITGPAPGATVFGSITVTADAADNVGVVGVQFQVNGAPIGDEDTAAPYSVLWSTTGVANGNYELRAVARDAAGNLKISDPVNVTVSNSAALPGLVAAFGFDEGVGATAADASGFANTGQLSGTQWTAAGRYGAALAFDGIASMVSVSDAASLDLTNGMTLEAWVNPSALSGWRTAILKESPGGLASALYAHDDAPRPAGYVNISSDRPVPGTSPIALNAWSHLAVTYDGAQLRLFVNGVEVNSVAQTGSIRVSTGMLRIGGNTVWGEYFSGLIDEVRIYNRALSAAEIQIDMSTPVNR